MRPFLYVRGRVCRPGPHRRREWSAAWLGAAWLCLEKPRSAASAGPAAFSTLESAHPSEGLAPRLRETSRPQAISGCCIFWHVPYCLDAFSV